MNESLNMVFLAGTVVAKRLRTQSGGNTPVCRVRLRLRTPRFTFRLTYAEVFGIGEGAYRLDLCSARGNVIYVLGHLENASHMAGGNKVWMEMRIIADEVRVESVSRKAFRDPESKSIAAVLAKFDPESYLDGEGGGDEEG